MKKVLIIPSWYPNIKNEAVGTFFREQAAILSSKNYDIKILAHETVYIKKRNILKQLIALLSLKKFALDKSFFVQNPVAHSFKVSFHPRIFEKLYYAILFNKYRKAIDILKSEGWTPDIIHAQSVNEAGIIANYLLKKTKIPFLLTEHNVFFLHYFSPYKRSLVVDAFNKAHKVAAVSEHQKKMILMQIPTCNPTVVWNFVDENRFALKNNHKDTENILNKKFKILTITYPQPIKDFKTFCDAIKILSQSCTDFEFLMIGNDSFSDIKNANSDIFIEYCKLIDIDKFGKFLPFLDRDEISEYLSEADVFVSTSIAETFGVAAREAMMCGVPVVTTACGGIEDSMNPRTGRVVPIRNASQVAAKLLEIKNKEIEFNPEYIRNFAIQQCGTESFINNMHSFYN